MTFNLMALLIFFLSIFMVGLGVLIGHALKETQEIEKKWKDIFYGSNKR